jgi:hypothetical protein
VPVTPDTPVMTDRHLVDPVVVVGALQMLGFDGGDAGVGKLATDYAVRVKSG